jgi:Phage integrase family
LSDGRKELKRMAERPVIDFSTPSGNETEHEETEAPPVPPPATTEDEELETFVRGGFLQHRIEEAHSRGRLHRERDPNADLSAARSLVKQRMEACLAPSTLSNYTNTMARFQRFSRLYLPENLSTELRIMLWLEYEMSANNLKVSAAHQYIKDLSALSTRLGTPLEGLTDYKRALQRAGALRPDHQAPPMSKEQVNELLQDLIAQHNEHQFVHVLLMWYTASRFDDIHKLSPKRVVYERQIDDRHQWNVDFALSKSSQFYLGGSSKMMLSRPHHDRLQVFLRRRTLCDQLTATSYDELNQAIHRNFPGLTCHSIKRGALMHLLQKGVSLDLLQTIAKHRSLNTLLIYLDSAQVAESLGMADAARLL